MPKTTSHSLNLILVVASFCACLAVPAWASEKADVLRRENLVAWCIVPFDAAKRGPAERRMIWNWQIDV